jgi:hypothetical protein
MIKQWQNRCRNLRQSDAKICVNLTKNLRQNDESLSRFDENLRQFDEKFASI